MRNYLNDLGNWLLKSSADPNEASLAFKGLLLGAVPAVMYLAGFTHLNLGQAQLDTIVDDIALVVQYGLALLSAGIALYGALRKLWNAALGLYHSIFG